LKLPAEREDIVGVAQGDVTGIGQDHAAAHTLEQLFPEGGLQVANLCAYGLGSQMQLPASARKVALACNRLKQPQMVEVECSHRNTFIRYYLIVRGELSNGQNNDEQPRNRLIMTLEDQ
jgi:hypothetical protein